MQEIVQAIYKAQPVWGNRDTTYVTFAPAMSYLPHLSGATMSSMSYLPHLSGATMS